MQLVNINLAIMITHLPFRNHVLQKMQMDTLYVFYIN